MKIVMPYIGQCLSVNQYRVRIGSRLTTRIRPEVRAWMEDLASRIRGLEGDGFVVEVFGKFCDGRVPDMDNLAKAIMDSIKVGTGVDDRYMRFVSRGYSTGWTRPVLEITISEI